MKEGTPSWASDAGRQLKKNHSPEAGRALAAHRHGRGRPSGHPLAPWLMAFIGGFTAAAVFRALETRPSSQRPRPPRPLSRDSVLSVDEVAAELNLHVSETIRWLEDLGNGRLGPRDRVTWGHVLAHLDRGDGR
jgi:hypothetical protein